MSFRTWLAHFLCPKEFARMEREYARYHALCLEIESSQKDIENKINQRVAHIISTMDPFEPLQREFHGVFGQDFERSDERLDAKGQLGMWMWGYQQKTDPHFKYLTEWIMNKQGNETLTHAPVTPERVLYGRAQLSSIMLFRKEVSRLASLYEDELERRKPDTEFRAELAAE